MSYHQNEFAWGVCDLCREWSFRFFHLESRLCADCWGDVKAEREGVKLRERPDRSVTSPQRLKVDLMDYVYRQLDLFDG